MIADLHCHYPMHLVHDELEPHNRLIAWWTWVREELRAGVFDLAGVLANNPGWGGRWRVDLEGLEQGGFGTVCSVLYWPPAEFLPGENYAATPRDGSFEDLIAQLDDVERRLRDRDPDGQRHVIVRTSRDLDDPRLRFVHCVEGGFHLGPDTDRMHAHVGELARRGIVYITLAHLFLHGVAANAPALPPLSDEQYNAIFKQPPGIGLTERGRKALEAMVAHRVVVDISHMRQDAIDATFEVLDRRDPDKTLPVIATHVGVRAVGPGHQAYNITPQTMRRIKERDGVIGVILAQHQLGKTKTPEQSRAVVKSHIDAIGDELGTHEHTAIGTDLDGFIKPTLSGIERAADMQILDRWIREDYGNQDAEAILHLNAHRVLRRVFDLRKGNG